ncbi:MAG: signal recognition particle-docking protein FtsY [Candidatus Diapherotrites archaeon]
MFDLLKKKIASFTERFAEKVEEKKEEAAERQEEAVEKEEAATEQQKAALGQKEEPIVEGEKRELKAKIGIAKKIKAIVGAEIRIDEKDVEELLDELELSLLEADVEQETAQAIVSSIKEGFVGKKISGKENVSEQLKREIKGVLLKIMETEQVNFFERVSGKKPFVILFLGPNGAGKTTTISKLTHLLQLKGKKVIWAASDTFRAASIEQLEKHAEKLGVRVVKHNYGADPAAVAFDAVKSAEAKGIDVVLIDSAGRQETNKNLMEEMKKICRVAKPDLKVYVGEAFTGQALLQQAKEFNEALGLDGFILTKLDVDAKGGTAISLLYSLKKPILFVGVGQEYADLQEFNAEKIVERIV